MVTEYENICAICGSPEVEAHHLVFGRGLRPLCEKYKDVMTIPLCRKHYSEIHEGGEVEQKLSKIAGQLAFEKEHSREEFRLIFGRSYL